MVDHFAIPARRDTATQLIVIAGGAASGKSTLAVDMALGLTAAGMRPAIISSDDFVLGDRAWRHDAEATGMPPQAKYDFLELSRTIGPICANQDPERTVEVPHYDPHTGLAIKRDYIHSIFHTRLGTPWMPTPF